MLKSKLISATLKTPASILLIGGIGLWSSSLSAETVPTTKDTAEHLEEIVSRNHTKVSDGMVQLANDSTIEPTIKRPSQQPRAENTVSYSISVDRITDDSSSDWQVQSASQDWRNLNRGDGSAEDIVRFVVWRF
ncbi:hypothetical protein [Myxosarcina sp. GI1(2024)]